MNVAVIDSDTIKEDEKYDSARQLSDNVLVVEVSGPDVHNLSIIDFPGFTHSMLRFQLFQDLFLTRST